MFMIELFLARFTQKAIDMIWDLMVSIQYSHESIHLHCIYRDTMVGGYQDLDVHGMQIA